MMRSVFILVLLVFFINKLVEAQASYLQLPALSDHTDLLIPYQERLYTANNEHPKHAHTPTFNPCPPGFYLQIPFFINIFVMTTIIIAIKIQIYGFPNRTNPKNIRKSCRFYANQRHRLLGNICE